MPKIVTHFVHPPIPVRQFDWQAYYDGEEELGHYGSGRTEKKAIDDLLTNHPPCKNKSEYARNDGGCLRCDADCGEACR